MDSLSRQTLPNAPPWLQRFHRQFVREMHASYQAIAERDGISLEQARARYWFGDQQTGRTPSIRHHRPGSAEDALDAQG